MQRVRVCIDVSVDGHYLLVEWGVEGFTGGECVI